MGVFFQSMDLANYSFAELFGNGMAYRVPRFQRDYAWDQEQWEDLWADIEKLPEQHHYMGYIVLQRRKEQFNFEIIDGQQRLVTLSLVIVAAMKHINDLIDSSHDIQENQERLRVLSERFIGAKNTVTLKVENKLSLNRNNKRHFREMCSTMRTSELQARVRTNRLLNDAFDFFCNQIKTTDGPELAQFIENLTARMIFTRIVVDDSLDAYTVFETLNARGVQLSTPDLLKNYLFSVIARNDDVPDERLDDLDEDWSAILSRLAENNFTDFIRYHHNFQHEQVRKRDIFRTTQKLYQQPKDAAKYFASLTQYAPIYAALLDAHDPWWSKHSDDRQALDYLTGLNLFKIRQPLTVLMIAWEKFSAEEFTKILRYLYVLSMRYNVICHYPAHRQDRAYNAIARKVFNGTYYQASKIKNSEEFKGLYPDDKAFRQAFEHYRIKQPQQKIRFILSAIEERLGSHCDYREVTLEHICPRRPNKYWREQFDNVSEISDRLGNMVLLKKDELGQAPYDKKKVAYNKSSFMLAKKVAEYDEWNSDNLNHYQRWLAKQAVQTWRVD